MHTESTGSESGRHAPTRSGVEHHGGTGSGRARSTRGRLRAVLVAAGLVAVAGVLGVASLLGLALATPAPTGPSFLVLAAVVTRLCFFGVAFVYVVRRLGGVELRLPTRSERTWVLGGVLAALVVAFGALTVGRLVGVDTAPTVLGPFVVADPFFLALLGVTSVLVGAPAEELLFRGAVQGRLRRSFGPTARILIASLPFAAVHALGFGFDPATTAFGVAVLFAVGVVLGTVYEATENLSVPVLVHGLYQATLFVVAAVVVV